MASSSRAVQGAGTPPAVWPAAHAGCASNDRGGGIRIGGTSGSEACRSGGAAVRLRRDRTGGAVPRRSSSGAGTARSAGGMGHGSEGVGHGREEPSDVGGSTGGFAAKASATAVPQKGKSRGRIALVLKLAERLKTNVAVTKTKSADGGARGVGGGGGRDARGGRGGGRGGGGGGRSCRGCRSCSSSRRARWAWRPWWPGCSAACTQEVAVGVHAEPESHHSPVTVCRRRAAEQVSGHLDASILLQALHRDDATRQGGGRD